MGAGPLHQNVHAMISQIQYIEGDNNADANLVVCGHAEHSGLGGINSHAAEAGGSYSGIQPANGKILFDLSPSVTQAESNWAKFSHERIPFSRG